MSFYGQCFDGFASGGRVGKKVSHSTKLVRGYCMKTVNKKRMARLLTEDLSGEPTEERRIRETFMCLSDVALQHHGMGTIWIRDL